MFTKEGHNPCFQWVPCRPKEAVRCRLNEDTFMHKLVLESQSSSLLVKSFAAECNKRFASPFYRSQNEHIKQRWHTSPFLASEEQDKSYLQMWINFMFAVWPSSAIRKAEQLRLLADLPLQRGNKYVFLCLPQNIPNIDVWSDLAAMQPSFYKHGVKLRYFNELSEKEKIYYST